MCYNVVKTKLTKIRKLSWWSYDRQLCSFQHKPILYTVKSIWK